MFAGGVDVRQTRLMSEDVISACVQGYARTQKQNILHIRLGEDIK